MDKIIEDFSYFLLTYFGLVWIGYTLSLGFTIPLILRKFGESQRNIMIHSLNQHPSVPVTAIMPAFNEAKRVRNAVTAILASEYKNINIIIVNDGSTDNTLEYLINTYQLKKIPPAYRQRLITGAVRGYYQSTTFPQLSVIDKEHSPFANSGADCLNAGLNACKTPIYMSIDSDTLVEPLSISRMLFVYLTNTHCIAIGGDIYVPDSKKIKDGKLLDTSIPTNPTLGIQAVEYLRSFIYGHEGWTPMGGALCHAGAFTLQETKAVMDVGGYDASNFSYDAEMIMKLHDYMLQRGHPYSIQYAFNAIAWAESPLTPKQLWKQRNYWQRGLLRSTFRHIHMLLNPRFKILGLLGFPFFILYEVIGPVIEGLSYIMVVVALIFQKINITLLAWFLALAFGYLLIVTVACMILSMLTFDKYYRKMDMVRLIYLTILDVLFYRILRSVSCVVASVQYIINRLRGKPL